MESLNEQNIKYDVTQKNLQDVLDTIVLPKFQRGFVWPKSKKTELLKTLHEGLPFGSILVYEQMIQGEKKSQLLDGQQRLSTIKEYQKNKLDYWRPLNDQIFVEKLSAINELLPEENQLVEKKFIELLNGELDPADWTDELNDVVAEDRKTLRNIVNDLKKEIEGYIKLQSLSIPIIKFNGEENLIAKVFENLNKGGVPLSKYELYGAAWINSEIQLDNSELQDNILNNVIDYYEDQENNGEFEINNFSRDDLKNNRKITLAELGTALGQLVFDNLPSLFSKNEIKRNELGFGILGIATNTENKDLAKLIDRNVDIQQNLDNILKKADEISRTLNSIFEQILKQFTPSGKPAYATGITTSFKILSYFAALWELDVATDQYKSTIKNIPSYYLLDALTGVWTAHGDSRLVDYYPKSGLKNYQKQLEIEELIKALNTWQNDQNSETVIVKKEARAILTIHANLTYMNSSLPTGENYEVEHIIPKAWVKEFDQDVKYTKLGEIGNLMYLPKVLNAKKQALTLYDYQKSDEFETLICLSDYPSKKIFDKVREHLESKNFGAVNDIISDRSQSVFQTLATNIIRHSLEY